MLEHWKTLQEGWVNALYTPPYDLFLILDNLLCKGESLNKYNMFSQLQYRAKEMQAKFAEISKITRISAIKLQTFASGEKAAKFRCFYCSTVGEISKQGD